MKSSAIDRVRAFPGLSCSGMALEISEGFAEINKRKYCIETVNELLGITNVVLGGFRSQTRSNRLPADHCAPRRLHIKQTRQGLNK